MPNRDDDLSRERSRRGKDVVPVTKGVAREVVIPDADPNWHPIAKMIYEAARDSGQSDFYQQSDWAILWSLCEDVSMYKNPLLNREGAEYHKRSGQMLQTIMSGLSSLLLTEGDRRRARIELSAPAPEKAPAHVAVMADYREGLGVAD